MESHITLRTAAIWAVLREELASVHKLLTVVDVGGGTGGFAVPLARDGHHVTVVDSNPNALAALTHRAQEAGVSGRVEAVQGDADDLAGLLPRQTYDLVLCHSLLEVVDDPVETLTVLVGCLRPGGAVSVVVANRVGATLAKVVSGKVRAALGLLASPDGVDHDHERLRRRFDSAEAMRMLGEVGLRVESLHGVRVVADFLAGTVPPEAHDFLLEFEMATSPLPPYRDIATQLHLFARKID